LLQTVRSSSKSYELTPSAMKLLNSVKRSINLLLFKILLSYLGSVNIFDEGKDKTPLPYKKTDDIKRINSVLSIKSIKK
jgi:hypothetical protein